MFTRKIGHRDSSVLAVGTRGGRRDGRGPCACPGWSEEDKHKAPSSIPVAFICPRQRRPGQDSLTPPLVPTACWAANGLLIPGFGGPSSSSVEPCPGRRGLRQMKATGNAR